LDKPSADVLNERRQLTARFTSLVPEVANAFGVHETTIYRCLLASDVLRRRPRRTKSDKC